MSSHTSVWQPDERGGRNGLVVVSLDPFGVAPLGLSRGHAASSPQSLVKTSGRGSLFA